MKVTMDGEYQTRDGYDVRIYCVDAGGIYPVHGAWRRKNGIWTAATWTAYGQIIVQGEREHDLVPKPKSVRMQVWVRITDPKDRRGHIEPAYDDSPCSFDYADLITLIKHPDGTYEVEQ